MGLTRRKNIIPNFYTRVNEYFMNPRNSYSPPESHDGLKIFDSASGMIILPQALCYRLSTGCPAAPACSARTAVQVCLVNVPGVDYMTKEL